MAPKSADTRHGEHHLEKSLEPGSLTALCERLTPTSAVGAIQAAWQGYAHSYHRTMPLLPPASLSEWSKPKVTRVENASENQEEVPPPSVRRPDEDAPGGAPPRKTDESPEISPGRTKEISTDEIWQTISAIIATNRNGAAPSRADTELAPEEKKRKLRKRKAAFRTLDIFGALLWVALFVKAFIVDIDRLIIQEVAPSLLWLLDLRFFLLLGALAVGLIVVRAQKVGWPLLYIAGFPIIVLFWKFPKLIVVNLRRPAVAFGILNVLTSFVLSFKPAVIALAGACLGALLIILGKTPPTVGSGMVVMTAVLLTWLFLAVRNGLRPSRFVATQQHWISKIVESRALETYRGTTSSLEPSKVHSWTLENANQYVTNAQFGLLMYRVTLYWAYSLDQYRISAFRILFSGLAILALIVELALAFAFLNYGQYRIDPMQYQASGEVSFWAFLYY